MPIYLFVGGPMHGRREAIKAGVPYVYARSWTSSPLLFVGHKSLEPCLELEEIHALTGRSNHRDPNHIPIEVFEREQLSHKRYILKGISFEGKNFDVYLLDSMDSLGNEELLLLIRDAMSFVK